MTPARRWDPWREAWLDAWSYVRREANRAHSAVLIRFRCKFCVVPEKEGRPVSHRSIAEIWTQRSSRFVVLLDNDFFGNPEWCERIREIVGLDLLVCFSQGLNIRIITDEQAAALASVKFRNLRGTKKQVHFAWDRIRDERLVRAGIGRVLKAGIEPHQMAFFVLVGFDTTPEQDLHRVRMLAGLGCDPFVMPYKRDDPYQRAFARWVNHKAIFNSVTWDNYREATKSAPPEDPRQRVLPMLNRERHHAEEEEGAHQEEAHQET